HLDLALVRAPQADDRAHQHPHAAAGPAHHAENLAAPDVQAQASMHHLFAKAVDQSAHANDRVRDGGAHQHISMNHIAAKASRMITTEIDCTTEEVVRSPTDCAVPVTCMPSRQPIRPISIANTGAFDRPTHMCLRSMVSCMRPRYCC